MTRSAPQFALGWSSLGAACQHQDKAEEARAAYQRAIKLDPAALNVRLQLLRLEIARHLWAEAAGSAEALIRADTGHEYPEAHLDHGIASFMLRRLDAARGSLEEAERLDTRHQMPEIDFYMGGVLTGQGDRAGAAARLRSYLERQPSAANAGFVREQIALLTQPDAAPREARPLMEHLPPPRAEAPFRAGGEAWVPGGRKALAAAAHMAGTPGAADFFLEYCRAIAMQSSRLNPEPVYGYAGSLQSYLAAIAGLTELGRPRGSGTSVRLSLGDEQDLSRTQRGLALLGWKMERTAARNGKPGRPPAEGVSIELGDQPADGPRQLVAGALGIDALAMVNALRAGRDFTFEIESEDAALYGGTAWNDLLAQSPALPGGMAEAFIRQPGLAMTYAGLAAMGGETGTALVRRMGLAALTAGFAEALWLYGDTFRAAASKAVVPGGADAEAVWGQLAGVPPDAPARFFEALLKTDRGRLGAFYAALARADFAHQRFFTADAARARRFYEWYRDSEELRDGIGIPVHSWRAGFFRDLPLTEGGRVRFPGGREAWGAGGAASDDDLLLPAHGQGGPRAVPGESPVDAEALVETARLERERGRALDADSARRLARNFRAWRPLFPYFTALPRLGAAEFEALDAFAHSLDSAPLKAQNAVMGEWHSLVELTVLGRRAGALDDAAAARAFGRIRGALATKDHTAGALAALREIAGSGGDPDEAVVSGLLRLDVRRRAAFERVRALQGAPRLGALGGSPDPRRAAAALAGLVYGAVLDPNGLLVNEDHGLLAKHRFVAEIAGRTPSLFDSASLVAASTPPGSYLAGGFANFEEAAATLARSPAGGDVPAAAGEMPEAGAAGTPAAIAPAAIFHASGRLVEVHTNVTDQRGRYIDDLTPEEFRIADGGKPVAIAAFENRAAPVSCALLLDTTASMRPALASLKSAALKLIGALRPEDSVAVYSLTGGISELQPYTTDKSAGERAVLGAELGGMTALYDGMIRVNRDLAARTGKKVIVVFTDGEDNLSTLTGEAAIVRAKTTGVPIYTVAQGAALRRRRLLDELTGVSEATGGLAFQLQAPGEIATVFDKVLQDLLHGYLLVFQPAAVEDRGWRRIEVGLRAPRGRSVRARQGYYPE